MVEEKEPELNDSPDDAKVELAGPEPRSNPADSGEREILEDYADDATETELKTATDLNHNEVVDLIALPRVGHSDFPKEGWVEARALASARYRLQSADYLLSMPLLGDYLEDGSSILGYSCAGFETGRL